jgi:transposase InsO family protein
MSSHAKRFFCFGFMVVDTIFFKRQYVFLIMDSVSRKIVLFNVTATPNRTWLQTIIRTGLMVIDDIPLFMVSDREGVYGNWFGEYLKDTFDMELKRTPPRTPNCNALIERWHRTLREEVLDHSLIFGRHDLYKLISEFVEYYHYHRPHQGLGQGSPLTKHGNSKLSGKTKRRRMVDGVITNFERAA